MNTFILMWNPAVSSFTEEDFKGAESARHFGQGYSLNWPVWDHAQARVGDRFYMVRVGVAPRGVVMEGVFASEPYRGEDWSGRGRETYYVDLKINYMMDSRIAQMLSMEELERELPAFEWARGHSGRLLPEEMAVKLGELCRYYPIR